MNDRIYDLKDVLKSLPAQATLDGLSVLCADTSGDLKNQMPQCCKFIQN